MIKYWYYMFVCETITGLIRGQRVCSSDCGEFDLYEITRALDKAYNERCLITYWREISVNQYEKMKEYFDNKEI